MPETLWAERTDCVYLTVRLTDIKDPVIVVEPEKFSLK